MLYSSERRIVKANVAQNNTFFPRLLTFVVVAPLDEPMMMETRFSSFADDDPTYPTWGHTEFAHFADTLATLFPTVANFALTAHFDMRIPHYFPPKEQRLLLSASIRRLL